MLQHHLQHYGNGVVLTGQVTQAHPKVQASRLLVTLHTDRHQQSDMLVNSNLGTNTYLRFTPKPWKYVNVVYKYVRSMPTFLAQNVQQSVTILQRHFLWHTILQSGRIKPEWEAINICIHDDPEYVIMFHVMYV